MQTKMESIGMMEKCATGLIEPEDCIFVFIDFQEKLLPIMAEKEKIVQNVIRLIRFSKILHIPILLTEQEKLGSTIPEIKAELQDLKPILKSSFSCFLCKEFSDYIRVIDRKTLILTGIEAHVCITQTALQALPNFKVQIVSDAVSSRSRENKSIGLERMRQCDAVITSTEMLIFELLKEAGTDEFRAALRLIK